MLCRLDYRLALASTLVTIAVTMLATAMVISMVTAIASPIVYGMLAITVATYAIPLI
jgi:hypothetical protein